MLGAVSTERSKSCATRGERPAAERPLALAGVEELRGVDRRVTARHLERGVRHQTVVVLHQPTQEQGVEQTLLERSAWFCTRVISWKLFRIVAGLSE